MSGTWVAVFFALSVLAGWLLDGLRRTWLNRPRQPVVVSLDRASIGRGVYHGGATPPGSPPISPLFAPPIPTRKLPLFTPNEAREHAGITPVHDWGGNLVRVLQDTRSCRLTPFSQSERDQAT